MCHISSCMSCHFASCYCSFWEGSSWVGSGSFKQFLVWHIRRIRYEFPRFRTISVYISAPYVWEDPENCLEWEIQVTCERPAFSFGYWLGTHSPIHVWYLISTFIWLLSYGIHVYGKYTMHGRDSWIRRLSPMSKKKERRLQTLESSLATKSEEEPLGFLDVYYFVTSDGHIFRCLCLARPPNKPRCSMYGICLYTYIWLKFMINVSRYSIHEA